MTPARLRYFSGVLLMASLISCTSQQHGRSSAAGHPRQDIQLILKISQRKLYVMNGDETIRIYPVAVGQQKYPTPTGHFKIHRIDWNPEWNPPESDWTKDKTYTPPGDPDNPMGRVRIVYQMPYTIHGTDQTGSLGKALSHGSIRMANEDAIELAKMIMKETGTAKSDKWYSEVLSQPNKMVSVKLSGEVPLTNLR